MSPTAEERPSIKFHYLKSPSYSTVHADGVVGSLTPSGGLHVAFFVERPAIPTEVAQFVNPDGSLGEEVPESRLGRTGLAREMQVDVVMSADTAGRLLEWLQGQIDLLNKLRGDKP
jgi:hypothetical protein